MRVALILLALVPIILSLAEAAPPVPAAKTKTPMAPAMETPMGKSAKKGKQLVYYSPRAEPISGIQHDEPDDEGDEDPDADDEQDENEVDEDADDDVDADDDQDDEGGLNIPDFNEVFPNPDGRPVGPNSYDAFMRHRPGGHGGAPASGPAAQGAAGPRGSGQTGPRTAGLAGPGAGGQGHPGPGQRRTDPLQMRWRNIDLDDFAGSYEAGPPPYPGAQLIKHRGPPRPPQEDVYPPTRWGRQGYYVPRAVQTPVHRRPVIYRPVMAMNRNYNYVPYRRPSGQVFYANTRPKVVAHSQPTRRVVQNVRPSVYTPVRRNTVVPVAVPMSYYKPRVVSKVPYMPVPARVGGREYNPWWSPLRGGDYNPEYVVNPTEMLSRRSYRYHPSQAIPVQRIPLYSGEWGNPRWTPANYHGNHWSQH